jgi:5-formyltetrahydrofolate cyclo-ligase
MLLLNKNQIRRYILTKRTALTIVQRITSQNLIISKFNQFISPLVKAHDKIAGYYPIASELNILPLLTKLPNQILLPVIEKTSSKIKFYPWCESTPMIFSPYANHILEPSTLGAAESPTIIIAPLIACDLQLNRIGSGKGMYDRVINELRTSNSKLLYIGLCYDFQLLDKVPTEKHDQKLDLIITESRIIHCS